MSCTAEVADGESADLGATMEAAQGLDPAQ
jgi:hypothetical protein